LVVTFWFPDVPQVITGGSSSVTDTVNEQLAVSPAWSVAVQVTVVVPRLKAVLFKEVPEPEVVPERLYTRETRVQLSVAVAFQSSPVCT